MLRLPSYILACCAFLVSPNLLPAAQITVGIIGDYGAAYSGAVGTSNEQAVANLVKSWNPDFIITTGDNNYPNGEASTIDTNIGQFVHEFIYPHVGAYGPGSAPIDSSPASAIMTGPSVSLTSRLTWLISAFRTTSATTAFARARSNSLPPSVISRNRTAPRPLPRKLSGSATRWRHRLRRGGSFISTNPRILPEFCTAPTPIRSIICCGLSPNGVTAIFAGHNHLYERIYTNGLNYTTIGLGGDRIDGFYAPVLLGSLVR